MSIYNPCINTIFYSINFILIIKSSYLKINPLEVVKLKIGKVIYER